MKKPDSNCLGKWLRSISSLTNLSYVDNIYPWHNAKKLHSASVDIFPKDHPPFNHWKMPRGD